MSGEKSTILRENKKKEKAKEQKLQEQQKKKLKVRVTRFPFVNRLDCKYFLAYTLAFFQPLAR